MASSETVAFATRLPAAEAERLEEVIETTDLSESDLLKRAARWYILKNPDNHPAFQSIQRRIGPLVELGILPVDSVPGDVPITVPGHFDRDE